MYSRYIPPSKGGSNNLNTEPIISSQITPQIPSTTRPQPIAYARYIPPPKPNSTATSTATATPDNHPAQHVRFGDDIQAEPPAKKVKIVREEAPIHAPVQESSKKSKKSKKTKRKSTQPDELREGPTVVNGNAVEESELQHEEQGEADNGTEDIEMQEPTKVSSPSIGKATAEDIGKRKEKKKKKKSKVEEESPTQVEEETPIRHKAILEKLAKSIQRAPDPASEDVVMQDAIDGDEPRQKTPEIELHGLEPIPQPKPVVPDTSAPTYETLPPWLASPTRVSLDSSTPFTDFGLRPDLGITSEVAERLASKGYKQAFAIQTGVIPLLLPHYCKSMQGDVLVSAATGSGKTLAYTLPMIRDISQISRHSPTRLRALIVLPTRELVKQVQQVCDDCAGIFALDGAKRRARIAMAMGSQSFEHEQASLIEREEIYDPDAYRQRMRRQARSRGACDENDVEENEDLGFNTEDEERETIRIKEDKIPTLPDHIIGYKSKVDILICTPGRLVEHIKFTPGFTLDFVRWLIVDEADKLLGQTFQQWLDVVIPRLHTNTPINARNHKQSNLSGVRKVILSATMTRDLDQLEGLRLRRPQLVVLEGSKLQDETTENLGRTEHVLPDLLEETALKVGDPNMKPLFLVDLLRSRYILNRPRSVGSKPSEEVSDDDDTSSSGSDSESDSDSDSDAESSKEDIKDAPKPKEKKPTVLIFTKSNETALRLSRLLALLEPSLEPLIGTITSTTPYTTRRDTFRSFHSGKLRIIVASDLVARGIDLPSLDHVINYDMPSSIASYVHRVGRTARAGNAGKAWTLFTNAEARWFWNEVASDKVIRRSQPVERVRITEEKEDAFDVKVAAYEAALEKLGQEAGQARHKGRKE